MSASVEELDVLALNSGSSSLKFGLYRVGSARMKLLIGGEVESIGGNAGKFRVEDAYGNILSNETVPFAGPNEAVTRIVRFLAESRMPMPAAIGHRIVHGGPKLREHCIIDERVLERLEAAVMFAPLHIPPALSIIRYAQAHFPNRPQVACFDTAFHKDMPDVARILPISKELELEGIQRYGFHGLSCESIMRQLADDLPERLIIAHLGNGASVTAANRGKSIDISMGLTPTGGVMMGTRSGDLDPGVLIYLAREKHFDAAALEHLVDNRAGLLGVSGLASDMRRLREAAPSNADAALAIRMFCYSVRKQIAAMIAALNGGDLIVFTGGIGENDAEVRAEICGGLSWVGIDFDGSRNRSANDLVGNSAAHRRIRVLPSQEDEQIARHSWALVREPGLQNPSATCGH